MNKVLFLILSFIVAQCSVNAMEQFTQLHEAARVIDLEKAKDLVHSGADVNKLQCGYTPLQFAAGNGHREICLLLLDAGAQVNLPDKNGGWSPLHYAIQSGRTEIVKLLLGKGADVNKPDDSGNTPLYRAAGEGLTEIVQLLLDYHALIDLENMIGETPLHAVVRGWGRIDKRGQLSTIRLLLSKGADINQKNKRGETPLDYATLQYDKQLADLLRSWPAVVLGSNARKLAFCMAMHNRVGADSPANLLSQYLCEEICSYVKPSVLIEDHQAAADYSRQAQSRCIIS